MRKIIFISLFLLNAYGSIAQYSKDIQVNTFQGFLIAHRQDMANMAAHSLGVEVIYSSNFTAWKQVDSSYKHLRWGTGFTYFNLGNKAINGDVYAWHIHIEANLKKRKNFQATLRFGSGIGYLTKPYNLQTNRMNKAIGSHLNGNMQVMYKAYFKLNNNIYFVIGAGVTHYSNGNFKRPNLGINVAHLNLGVQRKIQLIDKPKFKQLPILFPKKGIEINAGVASKQIAVADTRRFVILSTSALYYWQHSKTRNWRAGIDVFFDRTYPYKKFQPSSLNNVRLKNMTEIALKAGHEFIFGRVAIVTDIGTYIYRPNDYKKLVYFAIGFNYFFNRGIVAQTRLKSHLAVADYFYWSGGYRFAVVKTQGCSFSNQNF